MEQVFDFLSRLGEITIGIAAFLLIMTLSVIAAIEIIDFLIVDPITRNKSSNDHIEEDD